MLIKKKLTYLNPQKYEVHKENQGVVIANLPVRKLNQSSHIHGLSLKCFIYKMINTCIFNSINALTNCELHKVYYALREFHSQITCLIDAEPSVPTASMIDMFTQ